MKKRNILIVSGVFPPEPVTSAYMNYDLAEALSAEFNVTVLRPVPTRPINADYSSQVLNYNNPFKCITLSTYTHPGASIIGRTRETISFGMACAKYINENHTNIDFIYNSSWQLFGYYIVARAAVKHSIPYIVPIQDIYPECVLPSNKGGLLGKALFKVLQGFDVYYQKHAHLVRTISDEMAKYLSTTRKVSLDKYLVVNNWQDDSAYESLGPSEHDKVVFAFVGSINKSSRVEYMINAFIRANIPNTELRIYGNGVDKAHCEEMVKAKGISNIIFDSVPRDRVPEVQAECDVLLSALERGTAGLCLPSKLTSYMLTGRAIIVSVDKDSATARYLKESRGGIVVEPDNEMKLAEAFTQIVDEGKEIIERYGRNNKAYAQKYLTKEVNLNMVVNSIKEVLE